MSSDPEDNVTNNQTYYKPCTPMRNYTPRGGYSRNFNPDFHRPNANFNPEFHRPNTSRSAPFEEQNHGRQSKNRRVMTESEIEEEEFIKWGMKEQMKSLPHPYNNNY